MRKYENPIPDYADIMTVEEWQEQADRANFIPYDGEGHWCKDGKESQDSVWETPAEDATHVAWYNK